MVVVQGTGMVAFGLGWIMSKGGDGRKWTFTGLLLLAATLVGLSYYGWQTIQE